MDRRSFLEFSRAISEPLLFLELDGRVVASSRGLGCLWNADIEGQLLSEVALTEGDDVERYLRLCSKNSQPVVGALSFRSPSTGADTPCRCEGVGVRTSASEVPDRILLRLTPRDSTHVSKFAELSRSLEEKNREAGHRWRELEELRRHEAELSSLIDTTQDAVVFIDEQANIVRCNEAAQSMFGYSWEKLRGQPVTLLMPRTTASEHPGYIERFERTGEARAIGRIRSVTGVREGGEEFPIELSVTPIRNGHNARYGAFLRDVSEREALQRQLLEQERLASIGTTAAMFAHEVGNPLNGMSMNAQLALRRIRALGLGSDERLSRCMNAVQSELARMTSLLAEFRMLSKRQQFRMCRIKLQDLASELVEHEKEQYAASGVVFSAELPPQPVWVQVDPDKLKQALLNLTKNGAESIAAKGRLTLRVSATETRARIEVEDTGGGIPDDLDVFALFASTKSEGSGLGLPVVRQIIAAHDGSLTYNSEPGRGTVFAVELPLSDDEAPAADAG